MYGKGWLFGSLATAEPSCWCLKWHSGGMYIAVDCLWHALGLFLWLGMAIGILGSCSWVFGCWWFSLWLSLLGLGIWWPLLSEIQVGLLLLLLRFRLASCFGHWDSGWAVAFVTEFQVGLLLLSLRFRLVCVAYGFSVSFNFLPQNYDWCCGPVALYCGHTN